MTIAIYILKSILCMTILVAFYKAFLESEKMHHFNRIFLLGSIVFSMAVCFIPTGFQFNPVILSEVVISDTLNPASGETTVVAASEGFSWELVLSILYFAGVLFLGIKFVRNIAILLRKAFINPTINYQESKLILLNEKISPFTFLNYIFVCRKTYEMGNIDERLLEHELTHVRQKHSLDILFIELVKIAFWFNPVISIYKKVIQLNHEFLADEAVISEHPQVFEYQSLLLDTIINNKVFLASNINFQLTKKRLSMMTKKSSTTRKQILRLGIVPICIFMMLAFGKPANSQNAPSTEKSGIQDSSEKDRYFQNTVVYYKTDDGLTKLVSYRSLKADVRDRIHLPPPPPPAMKGSESAEKPGLDTRQPLPVGTVVYLQDNGSIIIGGIQSGIAPPPPPPPAPSESAVPPPPPPPPSDFKIPPPPPPVSVDQIFKEGGRAYINGKEASLEQVKSLMKQNDLLQKQNELIKSIDVKQIDGKPILYIEKKQ